jgi:hypothetical protein
VDQDRIDDLAARLIRQGYVDNEPDARLAAIRIILALERSAGSDEEGSDGNGPT